MMAQPTKNETERHQRKVRSPLIRILPRRILEEIVAAENPEWMDLGTLRMRALLDWDADSLDAVISYVKTAGE